MAAIAVCEYGLPLALAMKRLNGNRPKRIRAVAAAEEDVAVAEHLLAPLVPLFHQRGHRDRREVPEARACVAAGPHGLPTQPGGTNRSVGSLPSCPLKSSVMPQTKVHMNLIL